MFDKFADKLFDSVDARFGGRGTKAVEVALAVVLVPLVCLLALLLA